MWAPIFRCPFHLFTRIQRFVQNPCISTVVAHSQFSFKCQKSVGSRGLERFRSFQYSQILECPKEQSLAQPKGRNRSQWYIMITDGCTEQCTGTLGREPKHARPVASARDTAFPKVFYELERFLGAYGITWMLNSSFLCRQSPWGVLDLRGMNGH